jgi:hypothetical protein
LGDFFIFMRTLRYPTGGRYYSADVGREMQWRPDGGAYRMRLRR